MIECLDRSNVNVNDAHIADKRHLLLTSFSLYTNGKHLMNTRKNQETISCLDGLRYLSICWIIYGHTYYLQAVGVQLDLSNIPTVSKHFFFSNLQ